LGSDKCSTVNSAASPFEYQVSSELPGSVLDSLRHHKFLDLRLHASSKSTIHLHSNSADQSAV
jgi:hypothetical protein